MPRLLAAATFGLALACCSAALAEAPPQKPLTLGVGDSRFWLGGQIASGNVQDASLCDVVAPCPSYELIVAPGGYRLRVPYDPPSRTNSYRLELTAPDGTVTNVDGSN